MNIVPIKSILVLSLLCIAPLSFYAHAYREPTHAEMSAAAYDESVLGQPAFLKTLGITATEVFDSSHADPAPPKVNDGTARGWVREGAVSEDDFPRSLHHFFDPLNNVPLSAPPLTTYMSPDWALEDQGDESGQANSYKDARGYFYDALTNANGTYQDRNVSWGKLFQSLGQIVHHVQDMAQPQHVRNGPHSGLPNSLSSDKVIGHKGSESRACLT